MVPVAIANPTGVFSAMAAAMLFGLSTPAAKLLIGSIDPWVLAGLFYVGSGLGLGAWWALRAVTSRSLETALCAADLPWLGGAILSGGIIGPVLLMFGLQLADASTSSLLLTIEGVATALIAWFVFRENFDRRIATGMACIVTGAIMLAWQGSASLASLLGPLAIVGACIAWGIDNNLTRKVSLADPVQIAAIKGLVAGPVNLTVALFHGASFPQVHMIANAMVVGFVGYGVSLVLFVLALRQLGAARTGAYFSTAPFIGAMAAVPLLGERISLQLVCGGALMAIGVWLHLTEKHEHDHEHEPLEHEHRHVHDEHHRHVHNPSVAPGESHAHRHSHVRLRHSHPHTPDSHHQHLH